MRCSIIAVIAALAAPSVVSSFVAGPSTSARQLPSPNFFKIAATSSSHPRSPWDARFQRTWAGSVATREGERPSKVMFGRLRCRGGQEIEDELSKAESRMKKTNVGNKATADGHEQGDQTFAGPGTWYLESQIECEEPQVRARFTDAYMVVLKPDGTFSAAVEPRDPGQPWSDYFLDPRHRLKGRWRNREGHPVSEVTLSLGNSKENNKVVVLSGTREGGTCGTLIKGSVLEGTGDPVCVGSFKLTLVTREFHHLPVSSDASPDDYYGVSM